MTILVIDMPTDRVIWFTHGDASDVTIPDDRAALYQYAKPLPDGMTVLNSFKYKLVKGDLVLSEQPKADRLSLLESNKLAATREATRWFNIAAAEHMSSTSAGALIRRMKLEQASALLSGEETETGLLEAVAINQGGLSIEDAAKYVVKANETQMIALYELEIRKAKAMLDITNAESNDDIVRALAMLKVQL